MPARQTKAELKSSPLLHSTLPVVCMVTADDEFLNTLVPELIPWFQVVVRDNYVDLGRWTREENVVAVLLDIDTEGEDQHSGLKVLRELRELNEGFALISLSRSRTRLVEKEALAAGTDAHFRSPVDLSELRVTLAETIRRRTEEAAREQMLRQATPLIGAVRMRESCASSARRPEWMAAVCLVAPTRSASDSQTSSAKFQTIGSVTAVFVKEGDQVAAGQPLPRYEQPLRRLLLPQRERRCGIVRVGVWPTRDRPGLRILRRGYVLLLRRSRRVCI